MALGLCLAVVIQTLIQKALLLEAIDNVYAYEVTDKFEPVRLLKGYLNYSKKKIYKKGNKANLIQVCVSFVLSHHLMLILV